MKTDKQTQADISNPTIGDVKTEQGKEMRKYNAVKHNVLRQGLLESEIKDAISLLEALQKEVEPVGILEELLIRRLVVAHMRTSRAIWAEKSNIYYIERPAVFEERFKGSTQKAPDLSPTLTQFVQVSGAPKPWLDENKISEIEKTFVRYITSCERQFFRLLHELQRVQAIRKGLKPTSVAIDIIGENGGAN